MHSKKNFLFLSFVSFFVFKAQLAYALVDYTEDSSFVPKNSGARSVKQNQTVKRPSNSSATRTSSRSKSSGMPSYRIVTELSYGTQDVKLNEVNGKASVLHFHGYFATDYNIFLDTSYYQMSSSDSDLSASGESSSQKGNAEVKIGFNWLEIGRAADAVTIDLYGGYSFGQKNSLFATSRDDRLIGITTTKRFFQFVLGLGYELRMTGDGDSDEMNIGNIGTIEANLGWMVSNDIRFLLTAKSYRVNQGDENSAFFLNRDLNFSTISPKVILSLSPHINLSLGGHFQTRRLKDQEALGANLWGLEGAYGASLLAGLSFTM